MRFHEADAGAAQVRREALADERRVDAGGHAVADLNQAVTDFPARGKNLSRHSEMVDCYAALRPGGLFKKCDAVPVSYTHLDVYKRQSGLCKMEFVCHLYKEVRATHANK